MGAKPSSLKLGVILFQRERRRLDPARKRVKDDRASVGWTRLPSHRVFSINGGPIKADVQRIVLRGHLNLPNQ